MKVESVKDSRVKAVWPNLPKGLTKDQAKNYFDAHIKPRNYVCVRFNYDPRTGLAETIEETCR